MRVCVFNERFSKPARMIDCASCFPRRRESVSLLRRLQTGNNGGQIAVRRRFIRVEPSGLRFRHERYCATPGPALMSALIKLLGDARALVQTITMSADAGRLRAVRGRRDSDSEADCANTFTDCGAELVAVYSAR